MLSVNCSESLGADPAHLVILLPLRATSPSPVCSLAQKKSPGKRACAWHGEARAQSLFDRNPSPPGMALVEHTPYTHNLALGSSERGGAHSFLGPRLLL